MYVEINWERARAVSFLGIFISSFWWSAFAVFVNSVNNRKAWLRETYSVHYGTILPRSAKVGLADTSCCCIEWIIQIVLYIQYLVVKIGYYGFVTKLQRDVVYLGWPKSPSYIYEPKCGGRGGAEGTVHRRPNKLWRSNSIFNLWSMQSQ